MERSENGHRSVLPSCLSGLRCSFKMHRFSAEQRETPTWELPLSGSSRVRGNFHARFLAGCGRVNRLNALFESPLNSGPFLRADNPRHDVEGEDFLHARVLP